MRIVYIGAVEFSLRALEQLLAMKAEVVGVCTLRESKFNADHVDLSTLCERFSVPWIHAEDINSAETMDWINARSPDVIFCFGWSRLLKGSLLGAAPLGVVGYHPAALPTNRGRHPLIWALVLGLERTASTFFFMDAGADSGDILSQREILIDDADDARTLYDNVAQSALQQIEEFVPQLASGNYRRQKQDERLANTWRKRGMADGKIDWRMSARSIHNLVRGLAKPYVGAHFVVDGKEIKVWRTSVIAIAPRNIEPGKVLAQANSGPVVKCGEEAICLLVTEPPFQPATGSYL
jgi:methionyl-tRNA formyltransferase